MASNECWGIEVGSGAIKAIRLGGSGESVEVLDVALIPHKKVLSTPELDQADAMRVALGTLTSQFDVSGSVAVSVPGHAAFARFAKLPPVDPKKVPAIVKFEAAQQIPFPIEEVEWDYQTFVSPDSPDVEVGIFAITRERIMHHLAQLAEVGIIPDIVTLSPIAAYNALAYDLSFDEETPGTIMVDVGTQSTDLLISEPGRVWVRTFPIGGHHFTEALVEKFKLSYAKAERLKREAEQSQHARHVFQAMRPVFADLAQDIQRSIGYYQSLHTDAKLVRLIGLGSTFQIPGLRKYLKQQLQMHVYRLEGFKRLNVEGPQAAELAAHAGNFATAYGLALQGLGRAALPANLMPAPVVRETLWRRKVKWFGIAAGVSLATGATMFIRPFLDSQAAAGAPMAAVVSTTIRDVQSAAGEAKEVTGDAPANYDAANLIALATDRGVLAHIVDDVGLMLEDSQKVLDGWASGGAPTTGALPERAYVVKSISTSYRGPAGKDKAPVVDVILTVETTHPDATRFMVESLDRWLIDHESREGVPYRIVPGGPPAWVLTGEQRVDEAGLAQGNATVSPGAGRDRGSRRGGRALTELIDIPPPPGTIVTGGPSVPARTNSRASSSQELDQLAPLVEPAAERAPGTKVSTFEVLWSVEVLPVGRRRQVMKKALGWMRANWLIVLMCVVIVAAPVGFFFGASMWNKSIRTDRQERALSDYSKLTSAAVMYTLAPALPGEESLNVRRVPHADLTAHFKKLRENQAAQIGQVVELATERNREGHGLIVENLFPTPPDRQGQILRLEMQDRMVGTASSPSVLQARLDEVGAGAPPDANDVAQLLSEFRQGETEKYEAEFGTNQLPAERQTELAEALVKRRIGEYQRRAGEVTMYADLEAMPAALPRAKTPTAPDIVDCFVWQWDTWMVEDLLRAAAKANTSADGERLTVPEGPVKRIISMDAKPVPGLFKEGPQVSKLGGSGPLIATDPASSITGRVTHEANPLYDVRQATISMVVSSARLPEVLDAFSSTNFMGIVDLDVSEVDLWGDLKLGYYYGDEHVVKLDLALETIWLRSWTAQYMPETIRKLLKMKESA